MKKIFCFIITLIIMLCLVSCSKGDSSDMPNIEAGDDVIAGGYYDAEYDVNVPNNSVDYVSGEDYIQIVETGFISPINKPLSSFSLDSSSYAYTNIRRLIKNNQTIKSDAVVVEQMLNYFNYSYKNETDNALSSTIEIAECPWNNEHHLALISVNAKDIVIENTKNNFVFLIDVSGSMSSENKLGLFQESFRLFMENIGEDDTVSIVTYASGVKTIADGIKGSEKEKLLASVDELKASGSTNGSGGIKLAYEIAEKHFIDGGNNRILLATDGDFNVGISSQAELNEFISLKRESGVYLSIFGYGMGNTKHSTMETLATNGNGNAYYIDSILEAKKVFVTELGSVLNTVAKDCKIQVEFNPSIVEKYRLVGYENKMMTDQDFDDNTKDAGEIGAGHTTIAIYEIKLTEEELADFILKTKLRYKDTETNLDVEVVNAANDILIPSYDFMFAASVVEFALILRESEFNTGASYEHLLEYLSQVEVDDIHKEEFKELVNLAYTNYQLNK